MKGESEDPFGFDSIHYIRRIEDSKKLNEHRGPAVIISASGMCEGGRILHHLVHHMDKAKNMILIVGFQAPNTLGRKIVERRPEVPVFGKPFKLAAEVKTLNSFSAHADYPELVDFAVASGKPPRRIFLVHGEPEQKEALKGHLRDKGFQNVMIPKEGESVEL